MGVLLNYFNSSHISLSSIDILAFKSGPSNNYHSPMHAPTPLLDPQNSRIDFSLGHASCDTRMLHPTQRADSVVPTDAAAQLSICPRV